MFLLLGLLILEWFTTTSGSCALLSPNTTTSGSWGLTLSAFG